MSNDVSKVYLFLAQQGDWQSVADTNGDGGITKSEFREFMENNFDWDGETTAEGKNDLINTFWKSIDTNTTGKISGTNLKNKNALDSGEIANMETRIEMYEILDDFISTNVKCPSVVSDSANWKKSVTEGLSALLEQYGKAEGLEAYLAEQVELIMNKTTADYCANEYLNNAMSTVVNEYGYAYADDATLKGLIDSFVNNIPEGYSASDIQSTVIQMVDAYMATAGLKEDNGFDLSTYGYSVNENSTLNNLQKCVLQKTLEKALSADENYEQYPEMYQTAIESYLGSLKNADFENAKADILNSFNNSQAGKTLNKKIDVYEMFSSQALFSKLTTDIGESIAEKIKENGRYLPIMETIQNEAIEKAEKGEFDTAEGTLDISKLLQWIVDEISTNLSEFYPNGFEDMELSELNNLYDSLSTAADNITDNEEALKAHREAAISYCKAIEAKGSTVLTKAVKDTFGENYAEKINQLYPSEIESKMDILKSKVLEIGDVKTFEVNWPDMNTEEMQPGSATYSISDGLTVNSSTIDQLRSKGHEVKFTATASGGSVTVSDFGELTVNAANEGVVTVSIKLIIDGIEMDTTLTMSINVRKNVNIAEDENTILNGESLKHIMEVGGNVFDSGFVGYQNAYTTGRSFIVTTLESVQKALVSSGYNEQKTKSTISILKDYYMSILDKVQEWRPLSRTDYGSKGETEREWTGGDRFGYTDATGETVYLDTNVQWKEYKDKSDLYAHQLTNTSGFGISHSRKDSDHYAFYFRTDLVLKMFEQIYSSI